MDAKVSGRVDAASSCFSSGMTWTDGVGAADGFAPADCEEKGFAGAVPFDFEANGFEKGFTGAAVFASLLTPNRDSPILGCGLGSSLISFFCSTLALALDDAPLAMRTPLIPRTLPSFLLQVFLRQLQM